MLARDRIRGVIEKLREGRNQWQRFKNVEPGHRFQTRYHLRSQHRQRGETSSYGRIFNLLAGPALIIAGFAFLPTPGPSYIIIVIGMWMLSGEVLFLARAFDWTGVRLRNLWTGSTALQKTVIVLTVLACIVALVYWLI